jgi:hypothetical protein
MSGRIGRIIWAGTLGGQGPFGTGHGPHGLHAPRAPGATRPAPPLQQAPRCAPVPLACVKSHCTCTTWSVGTDVGHVGPKVRRAPFNAGAISNATTLRQATEPRFNMFYAYGVKPDEASEKFGYEVDSEHSASCAALPGGRGGEGGRGEVLARTASDPDAHMVYLLP